MRHQRLLPYFTGLLVATLVISNTIGGRLFDLGPFTLSAATFLFPLSFLLGDVMTEVYGYAVNRKVVWTGLAAIVIMTFFYQLVVWIPASAATAYPEAYVQIFSQTPRFVIASIIAYLAGEFMNSYVVAKMKVKQAGKGMGLRFVASTAAGQFFDSVIFITIAFAGTMPITDMLKIMGSIWLFKVLWEVVALPITIPLVKRIKRYESEDYYDRKTNFSPFKFD